MKNTDRPGFRREHRPDFEHSLISWKSVIAGLVVALFTYSTLLALGLAIGSGSLSNKIQAGANVTNLATSSAVWISFSVLLSLAAGAYFAARTSTFITGKMGAAQGMVIAGLFFGLMMIGAGQTIGFLGKGFGNIAGAVGAGASDLASNTLVQNSVENALGGVPLKSPPSVVIQGMLTRFIQGDSAAARTYMSYQTNLPPGDLDTKFAQVENDFKEAVQKAGVTTADAVAKGAWSVFMILVVGIAASVLSGAAGARLNVKNPLSENEVTEPYTIGRVAAV